MNEGEAELLLEAGVGAFNDSISDGDLDEARTAVDLVRSKT